MSAQVAASVVSFTLAVSSALTHIHNAAMGSFSDPADPTGVSGLSLEMAEAQWICKRNLPRSKRKALLDSFSAASSVRVDIVATSAARLPTKDSRTACAPAGNVPLNPQKRAQERMHTRKSHTYVNECCLRSRLRGYEACIRSSYIAEHRRKIGHQSGGRWKQGYCRRICAQRDLWTK